MAYLGFGAIAAYIGPPHKSRALPRTGRQIAHVAGDEQDLRRRQSDVPAARLDQVNVGVPARVFGVLDVAHGGFDWGLSLRYVCCISWIRWIGLGKLIAGVCLL